VQAIQHDLQSKLANAKEEVLQPAWHRFTLEFWHM